MEGAKAGLKQQAPFPLLPAALFTQIISNPDGFKVCEGAFAASQNALLQCLPHACLPHTSAKGVASEEGVIATYAIIAESLPCSEATPKQRCTPCQFMDPASFSSGSC